MTNPMLPIAHVVLSPLCASLDDDVGPTIMSNAHNDVCIYNPPPASLLPIFTRCSSILILLCFSDVSSIPIKYSFHLCPGSSDTSHCGPRYGIITTCYSWTGSFMSAISPLCIRLFLLIYLCLQTHLVSLQLRVQNATHLTLTRKPSMHTSTGSLIFNATSTII